MISPHMLFKDFQILKKMIYDALIPARGGSKRIPGKNIKVFCGKPLLVWSIEFAKSNSKIREVYVSTDSVEIARVAEEFGAKVITRPVELAGDLSTDFECLKHFLNVLGDEAPNGIIHLRPTYPMRKPEDLDKMISIYEREGGSCVRSVILTEHPPFKSYTRSGNILLPLIDELAGVPRPYDCPTQLLPATYRGNGYIDIVRSATIRGGSVSGSRIGAYVMPSTAIHDIDTPKDWERAERRFLEKY